MDRMRGAMRGIAVLIAAVVIACLTSGGDAAQSLPVPARIAFSSGGRLFTIAADGSDRHRLTGPIRPRGEYRGDSYPAWSPDGVRLAFVRTFPAGRGDSRS